MSRVKKDFNYYAEELTDLRKDKATGQPAPYQPLLLISLIESIEQGLVRENKFEITPELISTFIKYRSKLSNSYFRADLAQPFFHLSRRKPPFWHLKLKPEEERTVFFGSPKTLRKLKENVEYGYFDDELFEILENKNHRDILLGIIIGYHFPEQLDYIQDLIKIQSFEEFRLSLKEQGGRIYSRDDRADQLETEVRNAAFRVNVVDLYDSQCAFCKIKVISVHGQNIVDGAHIKPFSEFRDNRYTNGISLCKNHHWAFDRGWFSISDDYRLIVPSDRFTEEPPVNSRAMADFHGEQIVLPVQQGFYPSAESLSWHRERWNIA